MQRRLDSVNAKLAWRDPPVRFLSLYAALYVVPAVLLLLIAHYLVTVQFNVSPLYLRLASFAIPLPFGMATYAVSKIGSRGAFGIGAMIAFLSVSGMLTVIGFVDNVPIIPPTFLEWRESFEYGLSIALAFLTGNILALLVFVMLPSTIAVGRQAERCGVQGCAHARPARGRGGAAPPRPAHPGLDADGGPARGCGRHRGRVRLHRAEGYHRRVNAAGIVPIYGN